MQGTLGPPTSSHAQIALFVGFLTTVGGFSVVILLDAHGRKSGYACLCVCVLEGFMSFCQPITCAKHGNRMWFEYDICPEVIVGKEAGVYEAQATCMYACSQYPTYRPNVVELL